MLMDKYILDKLNSNKSEDRYDILIDIGKGLLYKYEDYVVQMLDHPDEETRRAAIQVLGIYWERESFIPKAEEMWQTDEDELIRVTALINWSTFFKNTNNAQVLRKLRDVFSTNDDVDMRREALRAIYLVNGKPIPKEVQSIVDGLFFDINSFQSKLNMDEIDRLMSN